MKILKLIKSCYSCDYYNCGKKSKGGYSCFCEKQKMNIPNPSQFPDWCPLEEYVPTTERVEQ